MSLPLLLLMLLLAPPEFVNRLFNRSALDGLLPLLEWINLRCFGVGLLGIGFWVTELKSGDVDDVTTCLGCVG